MRACVYVCFSVSVYESMKECEKRSKFILGQDDTYLLSETQNGIHCWEGVKYVCELPHLSYCMTVQKFRVSTFSYIAFTQQGRIKLVKWLWRLLQ